MVAARAAEVLVVQRPDSTGLDWTAHWPTSTMVDGRIPMHNATVADVAAQEAAVLAGLTPGGVRARRRLSWAGAHNAARLGKTDLDRSAGVAWI